MSDNLLDPSEVRICGQKMMVSSVPDDQSLFCNRPLGHDGLHAWKSDFQFYKRPPAAAGDLQAQIAALVAAVTARNQQISSLSEQVRLGFEASTSQQNAAAARAENLAAELKALSTRVHDIQQFQFDRAGALRDILTTIEQELSALESGLVEHDAYAKALNEKMASSEYVKVTNQMREFMGAIALHVANGEMEIKHKSAQLQHNQQLKAKKAARKRSK